MTNKSIPTSLLQCSFGRLKKRFKNSTVQQDRALFLQQPHALSPPLCLLRSLEYYVFALQAEEERQASHHTAGLGPSSSSFTIPMNVPSSSLVSAPSFATATTHTPFPAGDPRQPPWQPHRMGAGRQGPARQPFPAPPPVLHSIPSQVNLLPFLHHLPSTG